MDKTNNTNSPERFVVEAQTDSFSGLPEQPIQLQEQLIAFLEAQGGAQNLDVVSVLEAEGLSGLTAEQIKSLLQQSRQVPQAQQDQFAQGPASTEVTSDASPTAASSAATTGTATNGTTSNERSDSTTSSATESSARPPAAPGNVGLADKIMEQLSNGALPQVSGQGATEAVNAPGLTLGSASLGAPTMGNAILSALSSGAIPSVSSRAEIQTNAGATVPVTQPGTPPVQAPVTAPMATSLSIAPPVSEVSGATQSSSAGTSTSGNSVSRLPAMSSLGGGAVMSNASLLTPYVEQKVSTTGALTAAPAVPGSTESSNTKTTTSYVQPTSADAGGGLVNITQATKPAAPVAAPDVAPPSPFGNVTLSFAGTDGSVPLVAGAQDLNLPRKILEGTSPDGATPVHLMVARVNPLMPDDIPFVIKGLNGRADIIDIRGPHTITLTIDPDGTIHGLVHFEGGQFNQVLTINIRQDATVEMLEIMSVALEEGLFGKLLSGNHALALNVLNDDLSTVSVQANAPTYDGPNANDTLPQVVEGTGSGLYTLVSYTVTRTVPNNHGAETSGGVPLLADRIDWSVLTTGAGNVSPADIHPSDLGGTIDFADGEMSRVVTIRVLKDALQEDSAENLTLQLSAARATYSQLGTDTATTRIADDDGLVSIARAAGQNSRVDEGSDNEQNTQTLTFTVTRTNSLMADSFAYTIDGITQNDLASGSITGNTVSFAAGETSKTITVLVKKDFIVESDETVTVSLQHGTYAQVDSRAAQASVVVANDDKVIVMIAPDLAQVAEGTDDDGFVNVTFTVSRIRPDFHDADIPLASDQFGWSVDLGGDLSADDVDFSSGTVSFELGQTEAMITVRVRKDAVREDFNEHLTVSLDVSSSSIAVLGSASQATTLVVDDDGLWRVDLAPGQDPTPDEGTEPDQVSITQLTVTGTTQTAVSFLPAAGTVVHTAHRLSDFDPFLSSFTFGGLWVSNDAFVAQVRQVVQVSATKMTFWTVIAEGAKAIKVQVQEVDGGLEFKPVAQKYFNTPLSTIADLEVGGTPQYLATSLEEIGYGLHEIELAFRTDAPETEKFTVADPTHFLPTGAGRFLATTHTLAEFQPTASTFSFGGGSISDVQTPTVRAVDWVSPTSMNFWVVMSDPAYTKAVKINALQVTGGIQFTAVSGQYIVNNGQAYQTIGNFGAGFQNMGVATASNLPGYGIRVFDAVFVESVDSIPTEKVWLSEDSNYLLSLGTVFSTTYTLENFNPLMSSLQMGGASVSNDSAVAQIFEVVRVDENHLTFWAAIEEDGSVKAVEVQVTQVSGGLRFTPLQAKTFAGSSLDEVEASGFEVGGTEVDLASRESAAGYGLHHFEAAFSDTGSGAASFASQPLSFVVTRTNSTQADSVAYTINGVQTSDLANPDSGELAGVLQFAPDEIVKTVTIYVRKDNTIERDEPATIVLDDTDSTYSHTDPLYAEAEVNVLNDDFLAVRIDADAAATFEGNVQGSVVNTDLTFTVTRTKPARVDDSHGWPEDDIAWSVHDPLGQIVLGVGMLRDTETGMVSGVLNFAAAMAGTESQSLSLVLQTARNGVQESDWLADVVLEDGQLTHVNTSLGHAGTWVLDDDPSIAVDPNPPQVLEGGVLRFTIIRTTALETAFDLNFQLVPTSGGSGYISSNLTGSVTFNSGDTRAYVDVLTNNDGLVNDPRQVVMNLTGASNLRDENGDSLDGRVFIAAGSAAGLITSDDAEISIQSIETSDPDLQGMVTFTVTVARQGELAFQHGVKWTVVGVGENPLPDADITLPANRVITFNANLANVDSDTQVVTFTAPAGMIIDGSRSFEVRLQELSSSDTANGEVLAARTLLGVDAARGELVPNGVSVSVVPVLTNLAEGSTDGATHIFKIVLSEPSDQAIVVNWSVESYGTGTDAADEADFAGGTQFPSDQITIEAGLTEYEFSIVPNADAALELTQKFLVGIHVVSGPGGVVGPDARGSIVNDDAVIGFYSATETISFSEGMTGFGTTLKADVVRDGYARSDVSVAWHVELIDDAGISEAERASFADLFGITDAAHLPSGRVTIVAGQALGTIEIPLFGDNVLEASEKFRIVLESADVRGGATLGANTVATAVILNDDAVISMAVDSYVVTEGQGGSKEITLTVVRDGSGVALPSASVQWLVSASGAGAAHADKTDFAGSKFPTGTATFAAGFNTATIKFTVNADDLLEYNESFVVSLIGTTTSQHTLDIDPIKLNTTVTLTDDDDVVSFSPDGVNLNQIVTEDGSAHAGQTITYLLSRVGDTSKSTSVAWHLDFTGKTAEASDFADANGDPYADGSSISGTAVFAAGSNSATIVLKPVKDITVEDDETFAVVLDDTGLSANGTRLASSNTAANGTLTNDDVLITVRPSASTLERQTDQTSTLTFTVSRSGNTDDQATDLVWSVVGSTVVVDGLRLADALGAEEFSAVDEDGNHALYWAAGDITSRLITVTVNGDTLVEGDEAVALTLTNSANATTADLSNANGTTAQVTDNDATVWIERQLPSLFEGASGESHPVTFRVYRQGDIASDLTVALTPSDATGVSGPATVTFPEAGVNTEYFSDKLPRQYVDITYTVSGDNTLEVNETLTVTLGDMTAATGFNATRDVAQTAATTAITNDDNAITVTSNVPDNQLTEGRSSDQGADPQKTVTFTITRAATGTLEESDVQWRLVGAGQNQVNADDFAVGQESLSLANNGLPSGTVTFLRGDLTATVTVTLIGDRTIEPNEGMKLLLSAANAAGNLEIFNPEYTVTVIGDDIGINVLQREAVVQEGNDPTAVRSVFFDVVRMGSELPIYWKLMADSDSSTTDATATDFVNAQLITGALTFDTNGGALIKLDIKQDSLVDLDKLVTVGLYTDAGCNTALVVNGTHITANATLMDDDAELTLRATTGSSIAEGSDPSPGSSDTTAPLVDDYTTLTFTVERAGNTNQVTTVNWHVALLNGLAGDDFEGDTQGTVTFPAYDAHAVNPGVASTQTITLKVKTDWLAEADETVSVILGTPSVGTSLVGGSQSASTTVLNDDASVQFESGSLTVTEDEGDSGTTAFTFTLTRMGATDVADGLSSTVTWTIAPSGALNSADFSDNTMDHWSDMPTGQVTFAAGEIRKDITVNVNADTFGRDTSWWNPILKGGTLENSESFVVNLSSGAIANTALVGYGTTTPSVGTTIGANATATGTIVNDDVKIQITNIHTNLPEGTAPVGGDVDPGHAGVQAYIEQSITFERQGDPRQAVSFDWVIRTAGFADQMMSSHHDITGTVSWAANDTSAKTITFRPQGDDTVEPNFSFTLEVANAANSVAIDEFSYGTSTSLVVNRTLNDDFIPLATFNVMRDEAGVWVTNELVTGYNNWDSQQTSPTETYSSNDAWQGGNTYAAGDYRNINYDGGSTSSLEGSLGTAQAGTDYTALPSSTLTFTAENRSQTVSISINDDGSYETREGLSVFLNGAQGATIADSESLITIADNDNATPNYRVSVTGSTGIEGVDETVGFTVDLGKALTQSSTFTISLSSASQAALSTTDGEAADVTRYFEYSTDGGDTWQTNAPVFDFTYNSGSQQTVDDQLSVAYSFNNANSSNESWDSWLEFSDLKGDVAGQRVGNTLTGLSHGRSNALIDVVVNSDGGWVDTDGDRFWDSDEQEAFDDSGSDLIDLSQNSVSITFVEVPDSDLDLDGFGLDDRIYIDYGRLTNVAYLESRQSGSSYGGTYSYCDGAHFIENNNDDSQNHNGFDWYKGYSSNDKKFVVGQSGSSLCLWGTSGSYDKSDTLVNSVGDGNLSHQEIFDRVSFVNVGEGEIPPSFDTGLQQLSAWIAVRADAAVQAADLSVQIAGSGGMMQGRIGGVLDLAHASSEAEQALRLEFLAWWNESFNDDYAPESDADWTDFNADVKVYFDDFAARLTDAPSVHFVQVKIDWDGYGQMNWSVDGLDPTVVLAPQDGSAFSQLQLIQDITVDAGSTSASADVALGSQAIFDTDNSISTVAALESTNLQPGFEVTYDSIDANGVRTVRVNVTRPEDLGEDVVAYHLNLSNEITQNRLLSGSAALEGRVAFNDGDTLAELVFQFDARIDAAPAPLLPINLHVIVDHNPNDAAHAVGAYLDLDKDGVLDASEAIESNLAFSAAGDDLVGVNARSVTIRFNDVMDNPLDLSGFGGDDRIEINLDELSRYWKVGTLTEMTSEESSQDTISEGTACTLWDLSGYTVLGGTFEISLQANRKSIDSSNTAYLNFEGNRWTASGSDWRAMVLANFGADEGQNPIIDGYLSMASQVSFVKNPTVHVVVDVYQNAQGEDAVGAFIDLDKDGELDANEATADNLAFNADGSEASVALRHAPVVLHFNAAPDTPLNLTNFGRDDRIEIDVFALRENGWAIPIADGLDSLSLADVWINCTGTEFDSNNIRLNLGESGEDRTAVLGTFGLGDDYNPIVEEGLILSRVSFVNIDTNLPAEDIHVVVDHYDNFGEDAVGAFIDTDKDGVLDANEATLDNLAFNADGSAIINLARHHVTVQFNDAPDVALDFAGFGFDDRIEINLNSLAANGWLVPDKVTSFEFEMDRGDCSCYDFDGYTTRDADVYLELWATNESNSRYLELKDDHETKRLISFSDTYKGIGEGDLFSQVSFVRSPVVHVVVDRGAVYFDLDADGKLDANEYSDNNFAFDGEGSPVSSLDWAHQSVTIRFNSLLDEALDLSGFGRDDRIELDLTKLGLLAPGQVLELNRNYDTDSSASDSYDGQRVSAWVNRSSTYAWQKPSSDENYTQLRFESHQSATKSWDYTTSSAPYVVSQQSYSNNMRLGNHLLATFGSSNLAERTVTRFDVDHNPFHLIDANGGMLNRVSFVSSVDPMVLVNADGGWLDLNHDGFLQDSEKSDANRAFAADGSALINLIDDAYTLRFMDVPDVPIDLSGFDFNDRIEIDRSQFAARGFNGADNSADNSDTTQFRTATKAMVSGEAGAIFAVAGRVMSDNGVFLFGYSQDVGTKAMLGDFGPENSTGGEGDLAGRLSFVESTLHVVVESFGAFLDENANGKLDDNESIKVFDPVTGDPLLNLRNHKVVIEFNGVPDVALNLNGFGSDDRIEIDRSAFNGAGWVGEQAQTAFETTTKGSSGEIKGYADGSNLASASSIFMVARFDSQLGLIAAGGGNTTKAQIADFDETELSLSDVLQKVSFVQDSFVKGFNGDHPISLNQGGGFSSGGMQTNNTITAGAGTDKILIRVPIVNDNIDEQVETLDLTVGNTSGNSFTVPSSSGTSTLVDDDSPQITVGSNTLYDAQLQQFFLMQTVDINSRNGNTPHMGYGIYTGNNNTAGEDEHYYSDSLADNAGAAQSFTVSLRFLGQWELALISEKMPVTGQNYDSNILLTYSDAQHNSPPVFLAIEGTPELGEDGALNGYFTYNVSVPAGAVQIVLRSLVGASDLTGLEIDAQENFFAVVTHVDPIIVARDVLVDENSGTASVEVIAVGGDIGDAGVSVNVQTVDGQWVDRSFIVSREYATAGQLTLHWSVEALGGVGQAELIDGKGAVDYVNGYFGQESIGTVNADDFVLINGQVAGVLTNVRSPGLPTGTVIFADGQKEAVITVRVRSDNTGEEAEDFRVVLAQPPAGVQLLGNPDAPQTYANNFDAAGYARINNDDQLFTIKGLVINEAQSSKVTGVQNAFIQTESGGLAIAGTPSGLVAPDGYTLHQFIITREGDARAAATVDYVLQVKGIDAAGFIETASLADQGTGAHQAETADFFTGGAYGFVWGSAVEGVTSSSAKTVVFAAGEAQKVVTFAVANDALIEDAEQFRVLLTNPQALPGNDGNPGVSTLRGAADFLIGDNDGTTVKVSIGWLDNSSDSTLNSLANDLGNGAVDNALYEGTSDDWLTAGSNDDSNDLTDNDRQLVLTFTRSHADATASQAFFEIDLSQTNWGERDMVLESGSVNQLWENSGSSWWRGTVDFAEYATTATVVFRVPDDNIIEGNQTLNVTLYDAENLPQSWGANYWPLNAGATLADSQGIGSHASLPDWNTTIRDPEIANYKASATVVDDDIRLWLGGFRSPRNNTEYDFTPDGDNDTGLSLGDKWEANTIGEGNPEDDYSDDQAYTSTRGDFDLSFSRAGVQSGDITLNWSVSLGQTQYQDFNTDYWVDANGAHTTILADVAGIKGSFTLSGSSATEGVTTIAATITNLMAVDRGVEDNEAFQLVFSVDGSPNHVLFTPNYIYEAPGSQWHTSSLQGQGTMTLDVVALNDDVTYGIALASTEADNRVAEGDSGSSFIDFDISRALAASSVTAGYHDGSTVAWRVVAVAGYDLDESDFLNGVMSGTVNFGAQTWDGTSWVRPATQVAANGVTIRPDTQQLLRIAINPDAQVEYGEHFTVELYSPSVGYVDTQHGSVGAVILNDDTGVLMNNFSVIEGDNGTPQVTATVIRVGDLSAASSFNWTKYNVDTNSADFDSAATTGSATIAANTSAVSLDGFGFETYTLNTMMGLRGDASVEENEDFRLVLSKILGIDQMIVNDPNVLDTTDATHNAIDDRSYALTETTNATAYVTVSNDDTVFSVIATKNSDGIDHTNSYLENADHTGGANTYHFTITRSVAVPQAQTVTWSVVDDGGRNIVDEADFNAVFPTDTVTWAAGDTSLTKDVSFVMSGDDTSEADDVFTVKVTAFGAGAENDTFVSVGAKGVIVNDDEAIYINDSQPVTQIEGSGATTQYYRFDVVRSGADVSGISTVEWKVQLTSDGTDDTAQYSDFATLPTTSTASGWYDVGTHSIKGVVTFNTSDYDKKTVALALNPDMLAENTESCVISQSNPSLGEVVESSNNATGKIGDDDYTLAIMPTLSNGSDEGDGRNVISFQVHRTGTATLAADVTWTLQFGTPAAGVANSTDFRAITGNFTLPAGAVDYDFTVPVNGDVQWEENEVFTMKMDYNRNNGTSDTASTTATLLNDDEGFSLAPISDVLEGASGAPNHITFRVVREGNLAGSSTVDWTVAGSLAHPASVTGSSNDFAADLTGRVTFTGDESHETGANGQTYSYQDVTVALVGDSVYEENETYVVTLSNAGEGSSIKSATATGVVINDDMGYFVEVKNSQTTVVEGNSDELLSSVPGGTPPGTVTFVVRRACDAGGLTQTSTVAWSLASIGGDAAAVQSQDVVVSGSGVNSAGLNGTVAFLAGETSKEITITLVGDGVVEGASTLAMTLSRHADDSTSTVVFPTSSVTLTDDDDTLSLRASTSNADLLEGNDESTTTSFNYTVLRTGSGIGTATVNWAVTGSGVHPITVDDIDSIWVDGVQKSTADFASGELTWASGNLDDKFVEVRIRQDRTGEWDDEFSLSISNPSYGSNLGTARLTQTVVNDDPALMLSMTNKQILEGNDPESGTAFTFVVTRSGDTSEMSTVNWRVEPASDALNELDFGGLFPSGTVVFDQGVLSKTVTVLTGGDVVIEGNEDFLIILSGATNATVVGPDSVAATIVDDDVAVSVRAVSDPVIEGEEGSSVNFRFAVDATGPRTATRATVFWHVEGTGLHPTIGNDFVPTDSSNPNARPSGQTEITLRQGQGYAYIDIAVAGDNVFGPNEQFKIVIDDVAAYAGETPIGASAVVKEAQAEVIDDDVLIGLTQTSFSVVEGATGATSLKFYVENMGHSSSSPSLADILVSYHVGGATNADDFLGASSGEDVRLQGSDEDGWYIELAVKGDTVIEANERFTLYLDAARDATLGGNVEIAQPKAFVTSEILGDDYGIQLATVTAAQFEDSARFNFEVIRLGPVDVAMDVQVQVGALEGVLANDPTVVSDDDFINLDGFTLLNGVLTKTIHLEAGQGTARFTLEAAHDFQNEADERFTVMATVSDIDGTAVNYPTAFEVSSIDCTIWDEGSDMLLASNDPHLYSVVDHSV